MKRTGLKCLVIVCAGLTSACSDQDSVKKESEDYFKKVCVEGALPDPDIGVKDEGQCECISRHLEETLEQADYDALARLSKKALELSESGDERKVHRIQEALVKQEAAGDGQESLFDRIDGAMGAALGKCLSDSE